MIDHIGKENTLLVWFFCILLSISMRVNALKEGDRMGHKDDVLMDGWQSVSKKIMR